MQLNGNDRFLLIVFATFAVSSLAIKAAAGPPRDGWAERNGDQIVTSLSDTLKSRGFSTIIVARKIQSAIVLGQRGACRLSARDARGGKAVMTQFTRDAAAVGPVVYLYRGQTFDVPPGLSIRLGRLETEMLARFGRPAQAHIPVAVASSAACGGGTHGLDDIRIGV